jgi:hypothetical protein
MTIQEPAMSRSSSKAALPPKPPGISDLRQLIQKAEEAGGDRDSMILHLTFRDASLIKRSREVGVDEIRFADGEMRFLGVRVVVGDVAMSSLQAE